MIKIAFVIDEINIGGTENQLISLIKNLDSNFFRIYLICLRNTHLLDTLQFNGIKKIANINKIISVNGLKSIISLSKFLKREKIQIIQSVFFDSTVVSIIAAKLSRIPIIISSRRDLGYWKTSKLATVLKILNVFVDFFIVNSDSIKNYLIEKEKINAEKIIIIYNGIELNSFNSKTTNVLTKSDIRIHESKKIVCFVTNLNRKIKRPDIFVNAAINICNKRDDVDFIILGDGDLKKDLENLTREMGFSNRIHFLGQKSNVEIYLDISDIGVLTSDSEGFSNTLIEYYAKGLPVVASSIGSNREIICDKENGYLFDKGDQIDFESKLTYLLDNQEIRDRFSKNNIRKAQLFSKETMILKHQSFYSEKIKKL